MGKNKMIAKSCPKCEMQVAVASKSCKCGHTFFAARRGADSLPVVEDIKRRTGRVVRSQRQFYDAGHVQNQNKKKSPKKRSRSSDLDKKFKDKNETATTRGRRRRALRRTQREAGAGGGGAGGGERPREPTPQLRPAQLARCRLILLEINRKMQAVTWQPPADG